MLKRKIEIFLDLVESSNRYQHKIDVKIYVDFMIIIVYDDFEERVIVMKENKRIEYKQEINDKFLKTVSAFANYEGGEIIFGITDTGDKIGLKDLDKKCLSIENMINDSIKPKPEYSISINQKDNTITLCINGGNHTPYYYKNKAYARNDTSTVEVDDIELNRLILIGKHLNYEDVQSDEQNLIFTYFEKRLQKALGIERLSKDILKTLKLYSDIDGYNRAALLVSDKNSFRGIDVARFGKTINIILDRETFEEGSIVYEFDQTIDMFEKYYSFEEIVGAERIKKYTIPKEAFREALANAVVHRTWDIDARIRVSMFEDRIEICSPGGLPRGLSKEEYLKGQVSVFRNPILSNVFFRLNIIESFGTGIIKIKQAYEGCETKPEFDIFENSIKITLPTIDFKAILTLDEQNIVDYLALGRLSSSSEIAQITGFSRAKTIQLLSRLVEKRILLVEGVGRGTKYRKK